MIELFVVLGVIIVAAVGVFLFCKNNRKKVDKIDKVIKDVKDTAKDLKKKF